MHRDIKLAFLFVRMVFSSINKKEERKKKSLLLVNLKKSFSLKDYKASWIKLYNLPLSIWSVPFLI